MDFLKAILGDDLFAQIKQKIDAYNGDEANAEKQIKLANLGGGEYISKGKYEALQATLTGKEDELKSANTLIEDLKKSTKGNDDLQGKITTYEGEVTKLQEQLEQTKLESEIKVALLEAKATDIDYMTFKLKEKGELKLDEQGHIKGLKEMLDGLKVQFPNQFESTAIKKVDPNKLEGGNHQEKGMTKSDFLKKPYSERAKFAQENPETFKELMNQE